MEGSWNEIFVFGGGKGGLPIEKKLIGREKAFEDEGGILLIRSTVKG